MIIYTDVSIFDSPADVLVNTVNTVGVMGKGIAKEFKRLHPGMFKAYSNMCKSGQLQIGDLWLYRHSSGGVLNFPTKQDWRSDSKIEYIEKGLQQFIEDYMTYDCRTISFPQLGCGSGRLSWEKDVKPLMEDYLGNLPLYILIHTYGTETPDAVTKLNHGSRVAHEFESLWEHLSRFAKTSEQISFPIGPESFNLTLTIDQTGGETIELRNDQSIHSIPKESLNKLWMHMINIGICAPWMPLGESYATMLGGLTLLSKSELFVTANLWERDTSTKGCLVGLLRRPSRQGSGSSCQDETQLRLGLEGTSHR